MGTDSAYVAVANATGSVFATLDNEMRQRVSEAIATPTPTEWLSRPPGHG